MGAVYGYLRVSTGKQDADNQRFEILSYANSKKLSPVTFIAYSGDRGQSIPDVREHRFRCAATVNPVTAAGY